MKLKDKICLVTGGSRGIGSAIVQEFARFDATVCFTYKTREDLAKIIYKKIKDEGGLVEYYQMDVTDKKSVEGVIQKIADSFGRIDVLVNNAGINKPEDFDKILEQDWDNILAVNLKGPFLVTQAAFPLLRNSQSASVINISSVSGQYGGPRTAHYAVSKAGLISLSQVIARFGAKNNIRCNTVSAGLIASEMADAGLKSGVVKAAAENILLKRFGTFKEVSDVVCFLASEESAYITAQVINVNGGLYF